MKKFFLTLGLFLATAFPARAETVYDRVMASGKIRCGYVQWEPAFTIDPNTKQLGGIFYDLTMEMAKRLSLGVEWVEEVGWATAIEGMATGRYDAVCANFWPTPARARLVAFSVPVSYSYLRAVVRKGDPLLGTIKNLEGLNAKEITFAYVDGTVPSQIIQRDYSAAKTVSYTEQTQISDMLVGLTAGKGQVAFVDQVTLHDYLQGNPGTLVSLFEEPVAIKPNVMLLPAGDLRFADMINNTITDILDDGTFGKILKNHKAQDLYLPLAKPYQP
ncbi:MAG: transporter substrate-binding domain-containing protein [Alphaproteobacteria bacterium]|nr:transporter substrate-binding domain-containing protein [Alphaproteobacteria bacterium]